MAASIAGDSAVVAFEDVAPGLEIRVVRVPGRVVDVRAMEGGAGVVFESTPAGIAIRGRATGRVELRLPRAPRFVAVVIDGRESLVQRDGKLFVRASEAGIVDGSIVLTVGDRSDPSADGARRER